MERINVSEGFRFTHTNSYFEMKFAEKVDMRKAYKAMEAAVMATVDENGYYDLWLQDLANCCGAECFEIDSTLRSWEYGEYVPAMCKAVAETFPTVNFEAYASRNDLQCYCIDEFEVTYIDRHLVLTETFQDDDNGYFCPECGSWGATCGAVEDRFISDEVECEDCGEVIKVSDLKYVPPTVTRTEYTF